MSRTFLRLLLVFAALITLTTLCNFPRAFPPPEPTPFPLTEIQTDTPAAPCSFVWASQDLPELSAQLLETLKESGLPVTAARAEAYGENCVDSNGTVERFAAMQTDFYIVLTVETLSVSENLGNLLAQTLEVLDEFPVGETPGPNPGYIGITFQAGDAVENLWFQQTQADSARAQGLTGAALYLALKGD